MNAQKYMGLVHCSLHVPRHTLPEFSLFPSLFMPCSSDISYKEHLPKRKGIGMAKEGNEIKAFEVFIDNINNSSQIEWDQAVQRWFKRMAGNYCYRAMGVDCTLDLKTIYVWLMMTAGEDTYVVHMRRDAPFTFAGKYIF